ncbi:MAG: AAA family ATPase [Byssovorax sp.]
MIVSGYEVGEKIHESARSIVYRARRRSDGVPVILKALLSEHPRPDELARFRREFEIGSSLALGGVVTHHAIERYRSRLALVTEDFGAEALRSFARHTKLDLPDILEAMAQVAGILGEIHRRDIVHKDVNPSNLVIHPVTRQVKLIDFGIATALSRESASPRNLTQLEGTLSYISPEQTGRVNRALDYRTDLYSLGATFYELLTGEVPFVAQGAVEMIHAHIAREPAPPHLRRPEIPEMVSRIVVKLLSKAAEDRYQSGYGLQADLQECLSRWRATGRIEAFALGAHDVSDRFQIPQKLYGREVEIAALLGTFERASAGRAELTLVAGYSGIGKTALVSEIHKPIVGRHGHFISGKFDQLQRDIPYNSLIQAFSALVRQLLAEPEQRLRAFRAKLGEALGQSGRVVTDVIPEVELIIGPQPAIQELPPSEAQNRFNFVFRAFVHAFAAAEHPLVIFLDDLQWADAPSLKLLQLLLTDPSTKHLLVLGAYRDNEVEATHPLMVALEAIRREGGAVSTIRLAPLDLAHVNQLVSETLRCAPEASLSLATLSLQKTHGNPFFLGQFLRSLSEEKLLAFDPSRRAWRWDADEIRRRGITDNVVELMAGKIRKLPEPTQRVVKLAACIGNTFDLATLAIVDERPEIATAADLWEALREGLVLPVDDAYQLVPTEQREGDDPAELPRIAYRFLHDRVQQAAYSLISEGSRAEVHLRVGRLLLASTPAAEVEGRIFDIVHQLNLGKDRITDASERYELSRWNLVAGRKANASAAHEPALRYFTTGLGMLPPDAFDERYELAFDLHLEAIEAEHVNGHFERAQELSAVALGRSRTLLERVRLLEIRILFHTARVEYAETIRIAMQALLLLGVVLPPPETVTPAHIGEALGATAALLAGRRAGELVSLRRMTDPEKLAAVRVLTILAAPTYIANPMSFPLVVCKLVQHSLEHGNSRFSPYCYVIYGVVLAGVLGEVEAANEFGDLALVLLDELGAKELRAKVYTLLCLFLRHWTMHERVSKDFGREAVHAALEVGDLEYVGYGADDFVLHSLYLGDPLDEVVREGQGYLELLTRLKQEFQRVYLAVPLQMALALQGRTRDPSRLRGEIFDEDTQLPELLAVNNTSTTGLCYVTSATLAYLFGDVARTAELTAKVEPFLNGSLGKVALVQHNMYQSLALLALCDDATPEERAAHLAKVDQNQQQMKVWATHAPENFAHKLRLVAAERLRVAGLLVEAMAAFDESAEGAARSGFVNEEALAYERAAALYFSLGRDRVASSYLVEARYAYLRWGASAKVAAIDAAHPSLLKRQAHALTTNTLDTTSTTGGVAVDLLAVMKAAQTISGEIVLDRLLEAVMRSVLESAGAQRGLLIVERDGALVVAVERSSLGGPADPRHAPVDGHAGLSAAIVHYVERTKESVVLRDAAKEGLFTADAYVLGSHARSILCAPLINQGQLTAILYLENHLTVGAFTEDRLEVLRILSAQAALSIHNARLYGNLEGARARLAEYSHTLEQKVVERTAELREKNDELETTLTQLRATQQQLVMQEKLASLGALTAGIAHEIRNPLNFINNFAELSSELAVELGDLVRPLAPKIGAEVQGDVDQLLEDLGQNVRKIAEHGKRADAIVTGMLMHSRETSGTRAESDLNAILAESVSLTYHGMKAREPEYNLKIVADYDEAVGLIDLMAMEMSRVFVNIINNACYATREKRRALGPNFTPLLAVSTRSLGDRVEVRLRDNGTGIPADVVDRVFHPFFTTKPAGEGTGLGMSISHEIVVQGHQGEIRVDTQLGEFTELVITLPRKFGPRSGRRSAP